MTVAKAWTVSGAIVFLFAWVGVATALGPDHPVITEVLQDVPGNDGPVGRLPGNLHQEFIEIYLPTLADLAPALNARKDSLKLTFYEIEGDALSPGIGRVNLRIDLPPFDLDPSNGMTGLPRPTSGVVVLGWVDYVGNPPTALAGTASSRVALINGGFSVAPTDFTFIAINGGQFTGTTNFPIPLAISHLDLVADPINGTIEQGSAAFLLVDHDSLGYAEACAFSDPGPCNNFLDLLTGNPLQPSSLLDGFAGNDDRKFKLSSVPYDVNKDADIDLVVVLPLGGAFSNLVAQVKEDLHGYARVFVDSVKTTEDAIPANDDPQADALHYRTIGNQGPIGPTPGRVHFTTSAAELELADAALQVYQVLTNTTARPGILAANVGGALGMNAVATPGSTAAPASMTVTQGLGAFASTGPLELTPGVVVQTFASTPTGHTEVVSVQVNATVGSFGDPAVVNPNDSVTATFTAINPTTGLDAAGAPFQATTFLAVQGLPDQVGVANEFVGTSLGQFVAANLGGIVQDDRGRGAILVNPLTDLSDTNVINGVPGLLSSLPNDPLFYINLPGPLGRPDLVTTVLNSAEMLAGPASYDASFNPAMTLLQAREFQIPETRTWGGSFSPTEEIHYADAGGNPGAPNSGLTNVVTGRGFEMAILDSNVRPASGPNPNGTIESGATDDFGLIVRVGQTSPGSPVVPGEFVFLSFTGGLQGADIDTLNVPPQANIVNIIYLDLDPLKTVLGVDTITGLIIVDGSGTGEIEPMEVFTLVPEPDVYSAYAAALVALGLITRLRARR